MVAPENGLEPLFLESKSNVLPLYDSGMVGTLPYGHPPLLSAINLFRPIIVAADRSTPPFFLFARDVGIEPTR